MKEIGRREFLIRGVTLASSAALAGAIGKEIYDVARPYDETLGIRTDRNPEMSWRETEDFVKRIDRLIDSLPEHKFEVSDKDIEQWTLEVVPYFEYEGVTQLAIKPADIKLTPYQIALQHNHVLGRASCLSGKIEINARMANPHSSWNGREDFLSTLVHELAHVQGVCLGESEFVESSAQIITLEVLAAMVNHKNKEAIYPLLDELRSMGMGSLYYRALKEGKMDEFAKFRKKIYQSALSEASFEKSRRFWKENPDKLEDILYKYEQIPFEEIIEGVRKGELPATKVMLPKNRVVVYGEGGYSYKVVEKDDPFILDDLTYFLRHAEEIVEEIRKKTRKPSRTHF